MQIKPYIAFDGNGAEALAYYCETLGAEKVFSMTFGEMPDQSDWVTDENRGRLAHGSFKLGEHEVYLSDTPGTEPHKGYSGITIQLACDSVEQGQALFDALAADGSVQMPFAPTFWSKGFGMLADKYGVPWMISAD